MKLLPALLFLLFAFPLCARQTGRHKNIRAGITFACYYGDGDSTGLHVEYKTFYDKKGNEVMAVNYEPDTTRPGPDTLLTFYDKKGRKISSGRKRYGKYVPEMTWEYDTQGRLVREAAGSEWETVYSYGRDGRPATTERKSRGGWGLYTNVRSRTTIIYDRAGLKKEVLSVDNDSAGRMEFNTQLVYNDRGKLLKHVGYGTFDGKIFPRTVYDSVAYRHNGDSLYEEHFCVFYLQLNGIFDTKSTTVLTDRFVYNHVDSLIRDEKYSRNDRGRNYLKSCTIYSRDEKQRKTTERRYWYGGALHHDSVPETTRWYDDSGRLTRQKTIYGEESRKYNSRGQLVEIVSRDNEGETKLLYDYDASGMLAEERYYVNGELGFRYLYVVEYY